MLEPMIHIENITGLNGSEIQALQKKFGKNIFQIKGPGRLTRILWDVIKEPMFLLLLTACSVYFILGEVNEGVMMLVAMVCVTAISVYQEVKSSKALDALKQYTEPKVTVLRDGKEIIILSEELVPGDIILLEEGNRVPADAIVIQENDLSVNESIITGESFPVEKHKSDGQNQLLQGTTINSGKCLAQVTAIGNNTVLGRLGKSISTISSSKTLLQNQINRFVKMMTFWGLTAFLVIWLVNYLNNNNIVQSLLFGLTLAMSAIPEEIPVAFASFMALGAYYLARQGIITRQPQTIENLGSVSVICLDKTGTITENRMQVKSIYDAESMELEELNGSTVLQKNKNVLWYAVLASETNPFDAMEKAIVEAYQNSNENKNDQPPIIHEYPLSGHPPMMTHVYHLNGAHVVAAKGAPERILKVSNLNENIIQSTKVIIKQLASKGYRVLGVCSASHDGKYPIEQDDFNWKFEGLLALYDPPKKGIHNVFGKWNEAGITIKLLTGDYPETAINIAEQVGMKEFNQYLTGEQVMLLNEEELKKAVKNINTYARMFPDAKLKVIEALKANGEIVAMTGDGVNDGPAIKAAHIGIAMGKKGTELAKEASDLIITDDKLNKISQAILQGRKIYNNLKKAVRYIISIHIPIILVASIPLLLGWKYPNIFTPIHVIFLELIMGPTCSIFFEREPVEGNVMKKHPRLRTLSMFSVNELLISIAQGIVIAICLLLLYYFFMSHNYTIEYTRTMVFTTLILSNILLTFANRSFTENLFTTVRYKNELVPIIVFITIFFLAGLHLIPFLQYLFGLTQISRLHFLVCIGMGLISVGWIEIYKTILRTK